MRIRRAFAFWLVLALCAATVLAAMTWLTRGVLAAERERLTAQRDRAVAEARADLEERTRLALWRMDSLGAAIVLRENLVTPEYYRALDTHAPAAKPEVRLRFVLDQNRRLIVAGLPPGESAPGQADRLRQLFATEPFPAAALKDPAPDRGAIPAAPEPVAPQQSMLNSIQRRAVPADQLRKDDVYQQSSNVAERNLRAKAVGQTVTGNQPQSDQLAAREESSDAEAATGGLRSDAGQPRPFPAAPAPAPAAAPLPEVATNDSADRDAVPRPAIAPMALVQPADAPQARGAPSPAGQGSGLGRAVPNALRLPEKVALRQGAPVVMNDQVGQMRGIWLGGELLLVRTVTCRPSHADPATEASDRNWLFATTLIQGVWLDPAVLTANLLKEVADLLPEARLVPATDARTAADPLALVSFPFKLERGETPLATAVSTTPGIGAPLRMAWGGVLVAFLTIAMLLRGVLRLSERRASFVSAVTHELRTPLTTFRLYSDMLEQGAVKPEKRQGYLRVLAREADRLSHLVENVLAFSRIERGNARSNLRETDAAGLLESFRERFAARLATAGLGLTIEAPPGLRLRADLAAVEHILFNLIDNAAKYAVGAVPPTVEIIVRAERGAVEIGVADHGPGIAVGERRRVFRPFHKSAREAAESQPGVGLGLALSRRLARAQGGELRLAEDPSGARFILRLPGGEATDGRLR